MVIALGLHPALGCRGGPVGAVAARLAVGDKRAKLKAVKVLGEDRLQLAGDLDVINGPPPVVVALMIPCDDQARGALGIFQPNGHSVIVAGRRVRGECHQRDGIAAIIRNAHRAALRFLAPTRVVLENERTGINPRDADRRGGDRGVELGVGLVVVLVRVAHGHHAGALGELAARLASRRIPRHRVEEGPSIKFDYIISTGGRPVVVRLIRGPTFGCSGGPVSAVAARLAIGNKRTQFETVKVLSENQSRTRLQQHSQTRRVAGGRTRRVADLHGVGTGVRFRHVAQLEHRPLGPGNLHVTLEPFVENRLIAVGLNLEADAVALGRLDAGQLCDDPRRGFADSDLDIVDGPPPVVVPLVVPRDHRCIRPVRIAKWQGYSLVVGGWRIRGQRQQRDRVAAVERD